MKNIHIVIRSCTFDGNENHRDIENVEEITRIRREKKASLKLEDQIGTSDNNNKYFLELGQLMDTMNQLKVTSKRISPQIQQEFLSKAQENLEIKNSVSDPFGFMIHLTPETPQFKCHTPQKDSTYPKKTELELSEIHKTIMKSHEDLDERLKKVEDQLQKKQLEILSESESKDQLRRLLERSSERMKHQESVKTEELEKLKDEKARIEQAIWERDRSRLRREKDIEDYQQELEKKNQAIELLLKELRESELRRITYLEILQNLNGNLYNYCKIKRIEQQEKRVIHVPKLQNKEITFDYSDSLAQGTTINKLKESFFFDKVFGEETSIAELYKHIEPNIASVGDGKPTSLILIGSPDSGKLEALHGSAEFEFGLLQMSIESLLNVVHNRNFMSDSKDHLETRISCLEIYNEKLNDLLGPSKGDDEVKIMMEKGRVVLPDIEKPVINSVAEALAVIRQSSQRRQTEATVWNTHSSRSHSIYRITIVRKATGQEVGLLNIIDMAGSEKSSADLQAKDYQASGSKSLGNSAVADKAKKIQKEANFINKSLTTLGRIIRLIKQQRVMGLKDMCIPYRESKLTRMLQDCIGGDAQTLMIVNVNPAAKSAGQTRETLNFSSVACV